MSLEDMTSLHAFVITIVLIAISSPKETSWDWLYSYSLNMTKFYKKLADLPTALRFLQISPALQSCLSENTISVGEYFSLIMRPFTFHETYRLGFASD